MEGNYIGTDYTGTAALGNGQNGVIVQNASNNTIGGTVTSTRNIISANSVNGVYIDGNGTNSNSNLVLGNFIGTDVHGTTALRNGNDGVKIFGGMNNTVGGTAIGARNVISGNSEYGVDITLASGTKVEGNLIGTDVNGTAGLGNGFAGVFINAAANNTVGGYVSASRNIISANEYYGVEISNSGANNNLVQSNYIGTDVNGIAPLGNGLDGILIDGTASNNTIGGTAGSGNIIANSGNDGVEVQVGTGNAIRRNSIYNSTNLGIELVNNGNNNQPAPVLSSAVTTGSSITITGTLTAAANTSYALDFFANPFANPSGFGEGKQLIGSYTVTTNSAGTASFSETFTASVPAGYAVSATATDPNSNSSEFAKDVTATSAPSSVRSGITSDTVGAVGKETSPSTAVATASFTPSAAIALAAGPAVTGDEDVHNRLFALLSGGGQPTNALGGWVPFISAVTARFPSFASAGEGNMPVPRSLDSIFAAVLAGELPDLLT